MIAGFDVDSISVLQNCDFAQVLHRPHLASGHDEGDENQHRDRPPCPLEPIVAARFLYYDLDGARSISEIRCATAACSAY